ncbi:MAG: NAD+ synthase, partial [Woeseiaceae bacterium]|nr:NAD+ synthase [Woeseiaceae bacterium]
MGDRISVALAQLDFVVGDIEGNTDRILDYCVRARDEMQADLVVFPELSVCGYPPEDLLFHSGFQRRVVSAMERIRSTARDIAVLVGYPEFEGDDIYNAAVIFKDGDPVVQYRKHLLPNYRVFDEERYFTAGREAAVFTLNGIRLGVTICEDIWKSGPVAACRAAGAEIVIATNGSPYEIDSQEHRESVARKRVSEAGIPLLYVNMVGGQDELVFDGGSFAMDRDGDICFRALPFAEGLHRVEFIADGSGVKPAAGDIKPRFDVERSVYEALVCGTRDYVNKNGFPGVILGLSGGVDSALVATIAVDALGADRVRAVMMPFRYTSNMSQEDAARQAALLGIRYDVIPIEPMYEATVTQLSKIFAGRDEDVTEENIQARCRGLLLMSISNKTDRMLLTTGNKSEMAVGYATLYGDMAGGFAPIKDCSKSLVYRLARYRNTRSEVIPERVITRPPSAE